MRRLIVGCGYLGNRIARKWISRGDQVFALTRSPERASELQHLGICPLIGDVTDPANFPTLPAVDTLLYAIGYDRRAEKSRRAVTVEGLNQVLDRIAPNVGKLIYISTTSVYGINDGRWVTAETPCSPREENELLAQEAENSVWKHFPASGHGKSRACLLRLSGIYGRGRLLARQGTLLQGESLGGNPDAWLNLIHVEDAVSAILACEARAQGGETFLVSDDRPVPRRLYYNRLAELIGAPKPVFSGEGSSENSLNKRCENALTKKILQWELLFPTMDQGLPDAILAD